VTGLDAHLDLERLLALREPGLEPGAAAAREHIDRCEACRAEYDRLNQRVARLRALPTLRPARDGWPAVQARLAAERRRRRTRWAGLVGLATAASLALGVAAGRLARPEQAVQAAPLVELQAAQRRSQALEQALEQYDPERRVVDGRTAAVVAELEDRIAEVDRRLEVVELEAVDRAAAERAAMEQQERRLRLWRERVGLLDALVDVHVTRASNVGL
jgi:hypothetical protein